MRLALYARLARTGAPRRKRPRSDAISAAEAYRRVGSRLSAFRLIASKSLGDLLPA